MKIALTACAVVAAMSLLGCKSPSDSGTITQAGAQIVIRNNDGGTILAFQKERARLAKSGKTVVLSGYCASACTIFYSLPNACLAKGATLHFHGADGLIDAVGDAQMAKYYRAGIKTEFLADWKNYTKPLKRVTRAQARTLDPQVRFCEEVQ
jgi:hypothetical protein